MNTNNETTTKQLVDSTMRMLERSIQVAAIHSKKPRLMYPALREFYANANFEIVTAGPLKYGIDPYEIDWIKMFTPIEEAFWSDIRSSHLAMYPQYPVGTFFVDFACPAIRVCVECDGAEFHMDKVKDANRDATLAKLGWTVYRITGRDCKDQPEEGASIGSKLIRQIIQKHVHQ